MVGCFQTYSDRYSSSGQKRESNYVLDLNPEDEVWHTGQKEVRILDTLEPLVQGHRLTVSRTVIEEDYELQRSDPKYSFIQQFTRITRDKGCLPHEDRLEAVQLACSHFTERLNKVKQKQVDAHKEEALDEELRKFKRHYFSQHEHGDDYSVLRQY